jgi:SAM-dependent methyltransferase
MHDPPTDSGEFEKAYRERLEAGQTRWHSGDYDDFEMRPFLDKLCASSSLALGSCRALDLGGGTGQVACYLAAQGARVTGIDISPSAIAFAQQMAGTRRLTVEFMVGDLATLTFPLRSYDLIVDCRFLHYIVDWAARADALRRLREALREDGELWSETMTGVPEVRSGEGFCLDEAGVFWKALGGEIEPLSPIRRIHRDVQGLNREFEAAEFAVLQQEVEAPQDAYSVSMTRTRLRAM